MEKIAILSFTYFPEENGVANSARAQALLFQKLGYQVEVITTKSMSCDEDSMVDDIPVKKFYFKGGGSLLRPVKGDFNKFSEAILIANYDCIFVHCWQTWQIYALAKMKISSKIILISHGISVNTYFDVKSFLVSLSWIPYKYLFVPKVFKIIDAMVFLSTKKDNDRFYDALIIPRNVRQYIINNSVKTSRYEYVPTGLYNIKILVVGAFSRLKNEMYLLESLLDLNASCEVNFVGSETNAYSGKMEMFYLSHASAFSRKNIVVNFHYGLNEQQIGALYKRSQLLISTSKTECQPLVILQAMMKGIPFLSSNVGCVSALPGGCVFSSKSEFIGLLNKFCSSGEEPYRQSLSQKGYNYALENLTSESFESSYRKLLSDIL